MSVVFQFLVEFESNRPGNKRPAFLAGSNTLGFETFELGASLLPITDGVVGAEWYLLAARKQKFLAALHQVLLIESPRVHEILQHDHDHVLGNVADSDGLGQAAGLPIGQQISSSRGRKRMTKGLQVRHGFRG